jgi:predicted amidophosphoribosyltransferase
MTMLRGLRAALIDAVYPPRCLACTEATDAPHGLCPACWRDTHFISGPTCAKCGVPLIGAVDGADACEVCTRHPPAWDRGAAALIYAGAGRRMVLGLKHGDRLDMVRPLAAWMAAAGRPLLADVDLVAPVPLHWSRLFRRRYNQSAELGRALARRAERPFIADLLARRRATAPQDGGRDARAANQAGAFALTQRHGPALPGKRVLLVDDVLTSGATLSACADVLRGAGAAGVDVLALARVAFEDSLGL